MLSDELMSDTGVLILVPHGPLEARDFQRVAAKVDDYLETYEKLMGILIRADKFPGWKDFDGLVAHLKFVRDHHKQIQKVAIVTDDKVLGHAPQIASHFVAAELKQFPAGERTAAFAWLAS